MRKILGITILVLGTNLLHAQSKVTFIVRTPQPSAEPVFLVGSFNKWNPGDKALELSSFNANEKRITIAVPAGLQEYKFTRGGWTTVETSEAGLDITNRVIGVSKDTTIRLTIQGWLDKFRDLSKLP